MLYKQTFNFQSIQEAHTTQYQKNKQPNQKVGKRPKQTFLQRRHQISLVQLLSRVQLFVTPWTAAHQASLSITNSWILLKLMSIELVMSSNHLILCPSPSPPAFNLSQHQGLFQLDNSLHEVANILEFQL